MSPLVPTDVRLTGPVQRALPSVIVAVGIVLAVLSFWMHRVFQPAEFVGMGVESLRSEPSREVIVDAVLDAIAEDGSDIRALLEPVARRALSALLDSQLVEGTLVALAEDVYDSLLSDEPSDVVLFAESLIDPVSDAVAVFNEELAGQIREVEASISLIDGDSIPSFRRAVSVVAWQRWVGLALALVALVGAWALGGRLGETAGAGTAAGGTLALLAVPIARSPVLGLFTDERAEVLATEAYALATRDLLAMSILVVVVGVAIWGISHVRNTP